MVIKMYLNMTEQDYQGVRRDARLQTALALGISDGSALRAPRKIADFARQSEGHFDYGDAVGGTASMVFGIFRGALKRF